MTKNDIEKTPSNEKPCLNGCGMLFLLGLGGAIVLGIGYVWWIVYQIEHGLNGKGAFIKSREAMQAIDGERAIFWAKKCFAYEILGKGGQFHDTEIYVAQAYELDGQYEQALNWYNIHYDNKLPDMEAGRLNYKMGRKQEFFEIYCKRANHLLEHNAQRFKKDYGRDSTLREIRDSVVMIDGDVWLTPFVDYQEFMQFMKCEYEKLGKPPVYEKAMELYCSVETEIGDDYTLLPNASNEDKKRRIQLDQMREKLRNKRQMKK